MSKPIGNPKHFYIEQNKIYREHLQIIYLTLKEITENDTTIKIGTKKMLQSEMKTIKRLMI